jgi:hypothetical protein
MTWKESIRLLLSCLSAEDVERVTGYSAGRLRGLVDKGRTPPAIMRERVIKAALEQNAQDTLKEKLLVIVIRKGGRQEAADAIGCHIRSLEDWLYAGVMPSKPKQGRIRAVFEAL